MGAIRTTFSGGVCSLGTTAVGEADGFGGGVVLGATDDSKI